MDVNMAYMFANASEGMYKFEDFSAQLETLPTRSERRHYADEPVSVIVTGRGPVQRPPSQIGDG